MAVDGDERGRRKGRAVIVLAVSAIAVLVAGAAIGAAVERSRSDEAAQATTVTTTTASSGGGGFAPTTVAKVAADAAPGVVSIVATSGQAGQPSQPGSAPGRSQGSGFVLDRRGHILTNEHVVDGATTVYVSFADGTDVRARVVGEDPLLDLAVVEVDVAPGTLHPLPLGSASELALGDTVVAIGNPFGLDRSVSAGIVSGLGRQMTAPNGFTVSNAVQTDAPINHGNSGGPLLDAAGRVIGVNAQIADSGVNANVGVGFAVAMDAAAKRSIAQLIASGTATHAWLGVSLADIDPVLASSGALDADEGTLVTGVVQSGPADDAGIVAGSTNRTIDGSQYCLGGDVVTAANGRSVRSSADLQTAVLAARPGDDLRLTVVRDNGETERVTVKLGTQPSSAPEVISACS